MASLQRAKNVCMIKKSRSWGKQFAEFIIFFLCLRLQQKTSLLQIISLTRHLRLRRWCNNSYISHSFWFGREFGPPWSQMFGPPWLMSNGWAITWPHRKKKPKKNLHPVTLKHVRRRGVAENIKKKVGRCVNITHFHSRNKTGCLNTNTNQRLRRIKGFCLSYLASKIWAWMEDRI